MKLLALSLLLCMTFPSQASEYDENSSDLSSDIFSGAALLVTPVFPAAVLLAKEASQQNQLNVRKPKLSVSAQLVQGKGGASLGLNLEYNLTTDLNYWVVKASQVTYTNSIDQEVKQQKLGIEYRLHPYKGVRLGFGMGMGRWVIADSSESSVDFQFPIQWKMNKMITLYYEPTYSYWSKQEDASGELAAGAVISIEKMLVLRAGVIHLFGRNNQDDETLTSLNFALSI